MSGSLQELYLELLPGSLVPQLFRKKTIAVPLHYISGEATDEVDLRDTRYDEKPIRRSAKKMSLMTVRNEE